MKTPLCFCNGVIRSGSTWSFNVCRGLFQELAIQRGQPFGSTYLDGPYVEHFVAQEWISAPGPTVIKAHMIGQNAFAALRTGQARAVCTYRDPRDCVASDLVFMNAGIDYSLKRVVSSLEFLKYYQSTPHILLVKYEQMIADRLGEIRRIAAHLGVAADEAMIQRVDSKTNIESSKKVCRELTTRPSGEVLNIASHRVDPQTHLHEHHIGRVIPGRWKDEFKPEQGRWITEFFSSWLLQLGYETQESMRRLLGKTPARMAESVSMQTSAAVPMGTFSIGTGLLQNQAS